jgi:1-acyl-sn-glycerol-3-phosphate acyltransferase
MSSRTQKIWYWFLQWGCRFAALLFWRVRVFGKENVPAEGGCLLLANHQSFFDPPLCGIGPNRQLCYVARDSLFDNPQFGWLINSLNAIPIKRNSADIGAMKAIIEKLKNGNVIVLFPEATRTSDGTIADVKAGFGLIARRAKVPVLPVVIDGAFEAWPRNKKFPTLGRITVVYGKLITQDQIREMDDAKFAEHLTSTLRQMQKELRERLNKPAFR